MVKLTTLLLSGAAILAMSATSAHAAVAFNLDNNSLIITPPVVARGFNNTGSPPRIIDDSDDNEETDVDKETKEPKKHKVKFTAEQQQILDVHNYYRALHGAPPLTWNDGAAYHGYNHIQACQFRHSGTREFGENLGAGYQSFSQAIAAWYDEVNKYDYNRPGFSGATGHFTQVVWRSTTSVGCAKKYCGSWTIYICNYSPPGNIVGNNGQYFRDNVWPRRN
ncbi:hypothetical protein BGW41_004242 [Actinomortierella wolfii]|nr:hypothetical protein BGW41_004242 [Actinomortierella wolfii]